ncbi:MAG: hypothetical protein ACR2N9_00030 [Acidimicrobiia bacterium]
MLYGKDDPFVVHAVERMVASLSSANLSATDCAAVDDLAKLVASVG